MLQGYIPCTARGLHFEFLKMPKASSPLQSQKLFHFSIKSLSNFSYVRQYGFKQLFSPSWVREDRVLGKWKKWGNTYLIPINKLVSCQTNLKMNTMFSASIFVQIIGLFTNLKWALYYELNGWNCRKQQKMVFVQGNLFSLYHELINNKFLYICVGNRKII